MNSRQPLSRSLVVAALFLAALLDGWGTRAAVAQEKPAAGKPKDFAAILDEHSRKMFHAVAGYVAANPNATDVEQAYQWLFLAARSNAMEAEALPVAEAYLKRDTTLAENRRQAGQLRALGLAKKGKLREAMEEFDKQLESVRLRSPNETVDFGLSLMELAQMADEPDAVREILERMSSAFFLNPYVRRLCDTKLQKLDLLGKQSPAVDLDDLSGKRIDLADYSGKVVLVDFWGINCPPCLESFPALKKLYAKHHQRGFEIIGVNLNDKRDMVDEFQKTWKLPWPLVLDQPSGNKVADRYKVQTIPSMYLVDKKGKVVRFDIRGQNLSSAVERLFEDKK